MSQLRFDSATPLFSGAVTPPGIPSTGDTPPPLPPEVESPLHEIFFGPNGLRAGWRLLIFAAIIAVFFVALHYAGELLSHGHPPQPGFSMAGVAIGEGVAFLLFLIAS